MQSHDPAILRLVYCLSIVLFWLLNFYLGAQAKLKHRYLEAMRQQDRAACQYLEDINKSIAKLISADMSAQDRMDFRNECVRLRTTLQEELKRCEESFMADTKRVRSWVYFWRKAQ